MVQSRRQFFVRAILILIFLLASTLLFAQNDLSGYWVFRVPTGDGNFRETFFELKQTGENITGKVLFGNREIPITAGTFKDGKLLPPELCTKWDDRSVVFRGQVTRV